MELQALRDELQALRKEVASLRRAKDGDAEDGLEENASVRARDAKVAEAPVRKRTLEDGVKLEASVWDAALLMGTPQMDDLGSAFVALLLVVNVVAQGMFCYIVAGALSDANVTEDTVAELRTWRRNVAHHVDHYDELSQRTLAERVCAEDAGLEMSGSQAVSYGELRSYLGPGDGANNTGQAMCTLALFAWILVVLLELRAVARLCRALAHAPRGPATRVAGARVAALSAARLGWCACVVAARLVVVAVLAYYGASFVARTVSLSDLLLNAVALEFIIQMDELIFAALAPAMTAKLVDELEPLPLPPRPTRRGLDGGACACLAVLVVVLSATYATTLRDQVDLFVDARDAICAGERSFVYSLDGFGLPSWTFVRGRDGDEARRRPWQRVTARYDDALSFVEDRIDAVLEGYGARSVRAPDVCGQSVCNEVDGGSWSMAARADAPRCCAAARHYVPELESGAFSVRAKARESATGWADVWNPFCYDVLDSALLYVAMIQGKIADDIGWTGAARDVTCAVLAPRCAENSVAGVRARQVCPVACGCADPGAPLALAGYADGCPSRCADIAAFSEALDAAPCADAPVGDPGFDALMDDWVALGDTWSVDFGPSIQDLWAVPFRTYGCAFLTMNATEIAAAGWWSPRAMGLDFCVWGGTWFPVKPIAFYCPAACGCFAGDDYCPTTCPERAVRARGAEVERRS